jgi:hypothetical protein
MRWSEKESGREREREREAEGCHGMTLGSLFYELR